MTEEFHEEVVIKIASENIKVRMTEGPFVVILENQEVIEIDLVDPDTSWSQLSGKKIPKNKLEEISEAIERYIYN